MGKLEIPKRRFQSEHELTLAKMRLSPYLQQLMVLERQFSRNQLCGDPATSLMLMQMRALGSPFAPSHTLFTPYMACHGTDAALIVESRRSSSGDRNPTATVQPSKGRRNTADCWHFYTLRTASPNLCTLCTVHEYSHICTARAVHRNKFRRNFRFSPISLFQAGGNLKHKTRRLGVTARITERRGCLP